ncbi:MAG: hypothetical protein ACKVOK_07050 [Flavobacteriales bacterium]
MLLRRDDIIALKHLSLATDMVDIDTIPTVFRADFDIFFFGKTLVKREEKLLAFPNDVRLWTIQLARKTLP